jgi:hypothetical protein
MGTSVNQSERACAVNMIVSASAASVVNVSASLEAI